MPQIDRKKKDDTPIRQIKQISPHFFDLAENYLNDRYDIRYNEVSDMLECKKIDSSGALDFTVMDNEANLYVEMQKARIKISKANLKELLSSDFVPKYDPFRTYFEGLPETVFDPFEIDIIEKTSNFIKVKPSDRERFNRQFKKMLVRTIACALDPKVFNKQIFTLVGFDQNTGKSSFMRWLCPEKLKGYYSENVSFDDKDSNLAITENFIINIDELASLQKQEVAKLKSFISKLDDKSRRAYGARAIRRLRRASFVGSTNNGDFLTDTTGNVRWLCFIIDGIDWNYQKEVEIDQLWSAAYDLYKSGFNYEMTREEIEENEKKNSELLNLPPEINLISRHLIPATKDDHDFFITATDVEIMLSAVFSLKVIGGSAKIGRAFSFLRYNRVSARGLEKFNPTYGYYVKIDDEFDMSSIVKDHFKARLSKKPIF